MAMNIKKLKELLDKYPEESLVMVYDGCGCNDITSVIVEYIDSDEYTQPQINLSTEIR